VKYDLGRLIEHELAFMRRMLLKAMPDQEDNGHRQAVIPPFRGGAAG
jgi:hypothetical protein